MSSEIEKQKLAWQGLTYSIQRIDLLVISICGAGIYVCLELLKFLKSLGWPFHWSIYLAGIFFLVGISVNFISQIYGKKANYCDYMMSEHLLLAERCDGAKKAKHEKDADDLDKDAERFTDYTDKLTIASISAMASGLIAILGYFLFIF